MTGKVWSRKTEEMDMGNSAVKQKLRGPACVLPQGDSGVSDQEEEMPKASEGKPDGGVVQT